LSLEEATELKELLEVVLKSNHKGRSHHKSKHQWPDNPVASIPKGNVGGAGDALGGNNSGLKRKIFEAKEDIRTRTRFPDP